MLVSSNNFLKFFGKEEDIIDAKSTTYSMKLSGKRSNGKSYSKTISGFTESSADATVMNTLAKKVNGVTTNVVSSFSLITNVAFDVIS